MYGCFCASKLEGEREREERSTTNNPHASSVLSSGVLSLDQPDCAFGSSAYIPLSLPETEMHEHFSVRDVFSRRMEPNNGVSSYYSDESQGNSLRQGRMACIKYVHSIKKKEIEK